MALVRWPWAAHTTGVRVGQHWQMFLTAASTLLPRLLQAHSWSPDHLAMEGTLPAKPASPVQVEPNSHPSGDPRLLPSGLIPFRKLRNLLVSPKATEAWLPGEASPRSASEAGRGGPGHVGRVAPPGPPLIPSHFQQGEGSRKTPGTPGGRKRQAGRLARFVLDCIHSETRGSLHWTK